MEGEIIDMSRFEGSQLEFIRLLRKKRPYAVTNAELSKKKDFLHHRRSGLNHIILREMASLGIHYILNLSLLEGKDIEIYMGRMMQNIKLARKAGVKVIPSEKGFEVEGLLRLLGME